MNITTLTQSIRPDTSVPFYKHSDVIAEYLKTTYYDPGLIISTTIELSDDELTQTTTSIWINQEAIESYLADPVIVSGGLNTRADHNTRYDIAYKSSVTDWTR